MHLGSFHIHELNQIPENVLGHRQRFGAKYFWEYLNTYHEHMQHFRLQLPQLCPSKIRTRVQNVCSQIANVNF